MQKEWEMSRISEYGLSSLQCLVAQQMRKWKAVAKQGDLRYTAVNV
jgi:hypothetical protein